MLFPAFLLETMLVSMSGVMAPGPMTAVTIGHGGVSATAGARIAVGHAIIEAPLILLLFLGAGQVMGIPAVRGAIGIAGGAVLLFMAIGMARAAWRHHQDGPPATGRSPLISGILLSVGNPYLFVWWATAGLTLVMRAADFGAAGFAVFMVVHWVCDLAWLSVLSFLSFRGGRLLGPRFQRGVLVACDVFLVWFGVTYLVDGVRVIGG